MGVGAASILHPDPGDRRNRTGGAPRERPADAQARLHRQAGKTAGNDQNDRRQTGMQPDTPQAERP